MATPNLTLARLRDLFRYDQATGEFTRIKAVKGGRADAAGTVGVHGYRVVCIDYVDHRMHRLAWLYMTGEWPNGDVDHINGIRSDNRWQNLRVVPRSVNMENQKRARSNSKTGLLGVAPNGKTGFMANIRIAGKQVYLGTFRTPEAAHAAYLEAKRAHHEGCTI